MSELDNDFSGIVSTKVLGAGFAFILLGNFSTEGPLPSIVGIKTIRCEFCIWMFAD